MSRVVADIYSSVCVIGNRSHSLLFLRNIEHFSTLAERSVSSGDIYGRSHDCNYRIKSTLQFVGVQLCFRSGLTLCPSAQTN